MTFPYLFHRFPKTSHFNIELCLITLIISVVSISADQNIVKCDKFQREGFNYVCLVNEATISNPNSIVRTDSEDSAKTTGLALFGNSIQFLPVDIAEEFPILRIYATTNGSFDKVEKRHFENLKNLAFLTLRSEKLKEIPKDVFEGVSNLISLDISYTSIEYFHSDTFKPLTKLIEFYLADNKIQIIHPYAFNTLNNVEIISLESNNLMTLSRQMFLNKDNLSKVDAQNNTFVYLDDNTFDGMKLMRLDLKPAIGSECGLYKYEVKDNEFIDMEEVKRDIRDHCKGSDFQVYEVHAKIMDIMKKYGDVYY